MVAVHLEGGSAHTTVEKTDTTRRQPTTICLLKTNTNIELQHITWCVRLTQDKAMKVTFHMDQIHTGVFLGMLLFCYSNALTLRLSCAPQSVFNPCKRRLPWSYLGRGKRNTQDVASIHLCFFSINKQLRVSFVSPLLFLLSSLSCERFHLQAVPPIPACP